MCLCMHQWLCEHTHVCVYEPANVYVRGSQTQLSRDPLPVLTHTPSPPPLPPALFLQHCHFLRQAGHTEKAVSLFQAMVDFTFFKPDSVQELPTKGQV